MLFAAAALSLCLLLLVVVVPDLLSRARWCSRAPGHALLLWQAVGLACGLVALEISATLALSPAGPTHLSALRALADGSAAPLPVWSGLALGVGVLILLRLLSVLLSSVVRTLRDRHDNRVLVDLVATRNPLLAGTRVVAHDVPLAYCLPGLRSRVVLSRGVLLLLRDDELRAVLGHEQAHVAQRHDLVVLPFVALRATFPWLPGVRTAQAEVGLLVEMLADDRAARQHAGEVLARALYKVGTAQLPSGALGAGGDSGAILLRAQRLLHPPRPLTLRERAAALAATAGIFALAPLGLLLPMLS